MKNKRYAVLIGLIVVVVVLLVLFWLLGPGNPGETFRFTPDRSPNVRRNVTIQVPPQKSGRALEIIADALSSELPKVPAGKGIERIVQIVMEPQARIKDTREVVTDFDPPLTVTIEFTAEDSKAVPRGSEGKPQLSLITFYKDGDNWKLERIQPTTITCATSACDTGTLSGQVRTFRPNDPVGEGFP